MEPSEQTSQFGQNLALFIALAAIFLSPFASWLIMWFQERGATRRFNAERNRQLADEFRREVASMLSTINNQAGQMLMLQELGQGIAKADYKEFHTTMALIDELGLAGAKLGQSVHLLIDRDSKEGNDLVVSMIDLSNLIDSRLNPNFPDGSVFESLGSMEEINAAQAKVSKMAFEIIKKLQAPV